MASPASSQLPAFLSRLREQGDVLLSVLMASFLVKCFAPGDLREDEMFRPNNTQHFLLSRGVCEHFPPGHPQHNPHGVWNLR